MPQYTALTRLTHSEEEDAVAIHVMELYSAAPASTGLGFISPNAPSVELDLGEYALTVAQSPGALTSSSNANSTTGFVCWQTSPLFVRWLLYDPKCPFKDLFQTPMTVVELGLGVSGVLAATLGTLSTVKHFVATDQPGLLKLLLQNIARNVPTMDSTTISNIGKKQKGRVVPRIDVWEYDWEDPDSLIGVLEGPPDLIVACDTIYNEYLIPHFINGLFQLRGAQTVALVALQLRDSDMIEAFVEALVARAEREGMEVYCLKDEALGLLHSGFMVYYVEGASPTGTGGIDANR